MVRVQLTLSAVGPALSLGATENQYRFTSPPAQMLTFIMLARLSVLCPNAVLQRLERLIEPLRATCSTKVRAGLCKGWG